MHTPYFRHNRGFGHVLTVGQGDTGQLGLGEDVMEKSRPGLVSSLSDAVDIVAGKRFDSINPLIHCCSPGYQDTIPIRTIY